jgi:hypothetical protein
MVKIHPNIKINTPEKLLFFVNRNQRAIIDAIYDKGVIGEKDNYWEELYTAIPKLITTHSQSLIKNTVKISDEEDVYEIFLTLINKAYYHYDYRSGEININNNIIYYLFR